MGRAGSFKGCRLFCVYREDHQSFRQYFSLPIYGRLLISDMIYLNYHFQKIDVHKRSGPNAIDDSGNR